MKKSSYVKFHTKQALNLLIISLVFNIAFAILGSILAFTIVLIPIIIFIEVIVSITIFVLWIIGLVNSINGKNDEIPIVGSYADKYLKF
ncbi:MAG: hypothetical protein PF569_03560 [Candidatus Woesearchaeota archaeon]|jgi:uncharacterized membrane protein|nr:hypothetical protein [Candidatus Woesearchaeota archaeon]